MVKLFLSILLAGSALAGCSLAPEFKNPDTALPAAFKKQPLGADEATGNAWKPAVSLEKEDRGKWWKIFADPELDALEKQAIEANQSLKAAGARLEQARAVVRANASSFLPDIDVGGNAVRAKSSGASIAAFSPNPALNLEPYTLYTANASASYEADVFGRVRDNENAFRFDADAEEALYRSALLILQADVAQHYFQLQALDAERALLQDTITIRTEAQRIMQKRLDVGAASEVDISRTESELAEANAELISLNRTRAEVENALSVLLGRNPSTFHFNQMRAENTQPPLIPAGIPSEVLQRRPDIAAAQSAMQAANRRIGVARTAFFPSLLLTVSGGSGSTTLSDIFKWSSRAWALGQTAGSALAMNLFDSGRNFGTLDAAHAAYDEAVANYRQQVLTAMADVENALHNQRLLAEQSRQLDVAASATRHTQDLTKKRYDQGDANYFEVANEQRAMLSANRAAIQARGQRFIATIALIRALGGGWEPNNPIE